MKIERESAAIQFAADKLKINLDDFRYEILHKGFWPPKWTWTDEETGRLNRIDILFHSLDSKETYGLIVGINTTKSYNGRMSCWQIDYAI